MTIIRIEALESRRLLSAGDQDLSFGTGGVVVEPVEPIAALPDGRYIHADGNEVKRFLGNGQPDPTFGTNGTVTTTNRVDFAHVIRLQPDGKILVGGSPGEFSEAGNVTVARFNADGSPDTGFGDGGMLVIDFGHDDELADIVVAPDGRVAVLATSTAVGTQIPQGFVGGAVVAVLEPDGDFDASFSDDGILVWSPSRGWFGDPFLTSIATAAEFNVDGTLFVAGSLTTRPFDLQTSPQTTEAIVHGLRSDGSRAFAITMPQNVVNGQPVQDTDHAVRDLAANGDGSVLVAVAGGAGRNMILARLDATGQFDTGVFGGGAGYLSIPLPADEASETRGGAYQLERLADGRFHVRARNNESRPAFRTQTNQFLYRFNHDGTLDPVFPAPLLLRTSQPVTQSPIDARFIVIGDDVIVPLFGERLDDGPAFPQGLMKFLGGETIRSTRNGTLLIGGTSGDDAINITRRVRDGRILVDVNGEARVFLPQLIKRIQAYGFGGNDAMTVGPNVRSSFLHGGDGNDTLIGGDGDDYLVGAVGNDSLTGGLGNDTLEGNAGNDYLLGSAGHDVIYGQGGRDTLLGTLGNDRLFGGPGSADQVYGGPGTDAAANDPLDTYAGVEQLLA
jgi:uncharacterized delta-60 repeat protein